jgi:hypothetical protein
MYASLSLDLGLGSHAGQGTRHGPKSVLISARRRAIGGSQNTGLKFKAASFTPGELITF